MNEFSILVVDDNKDFLKGIIRNLQKKFPTMEILGASSGEEGLKVFRKKNVGVMLSDLRMPGISGQELLQAGIEINPLVCVIMITGHGTVETAVKALKRGAWDFLTKPVERETLYHTVERAVEHYDLSYENRRLQEVIESLKHEKGFLSESQVMQQLQKKITAIAATDYTVLVTGESGSGKEYIARNIHGTSRRKQASCHALNCPAIPELLLESELFGHVKGAFTGADRDRDGFFMYADKGTLILDEIGDISPAIQAKLLKFLQDREVKPVGSSISKTADVRIIALTNQNLEQKIREGSFREDLYYRLNVLSVRVPPLRKRREDIPVLVRDFILQSCRELNMEPMEIDPAALGFITRQSWPGNVRQLLNYVRRLVVFSNGNPIDLSLIRLIEGEEGPVPETDSKGRASYKEAKKEALDHFSRNYLDQIFKITRGNISETSRISGLERASIQKIVKRLGMDMSRYREQSLGRNTQVL
ncbi:sigma-54-dependent transcriptional regulator [Desulfospira joergensenii]|uniref:sigma-54-dependent transcriptional regulator n=1 Tax=Desulfospira joergensenii TaxID=53329 RepID=UPI0003B44488|nr:sigma-54 dependent transcriptional regulator [Desulfospira joergensenii]